MAPFCRKTTVWKRPKRISTKNTKKISSSSSCLLSVTVLVFVLCLFLSFLFFVLVYCFYLQLYKQNQKIQRDTDTERYREILGLFFSLSLRVPSFDNMRKKLDTRFPAVSLSFFFLCSLFVCVYVLLFLCLFLFNITVYFCFHGHGVFLFLLFVHLGCVSFRLFVLYVSCMK